MRPEGSARIADEARPTTDGSRACIFHGGRSPHRRTSGDGVDQSLTPGRPKVPLRFSKMHGLGNDFVVLDARGGGPVPGAAGTRTMADRHTGVGFDQLLVIESARDPGCAAAYSIRNADGSAAGQCGNGARCIAAWLHRAGALPAGIDAHFESPAGRVRMRLLDATTVAVEMGEPDFDPARIPFDAPAAADTYPLDVDGERITITAVSMGNPHAVTRVADVQDPRVDRLGPALTRHPRFHDGANAGFVEVVDRTHIRLRVHERGAGWTRACGTGACAAMAALRRQGLVDDRVQVILPGGTLSIAWPGTGSTLWMTGPAAFTFEGTWLGI